MEQYEKQIELDAAHTLNVFGDYDKHLKRIEKILQVTIVDRNGSVRIRGLKRHVEQAADVLQRLQELSERGNLIQEQNVEYAIDEHGRQYGRTFGNRRRSDLPHRERKAHQAQDAGTEAVCGRHPGQHDRIRHGPRWNGKNLSRHGDGDYSL